MKLDELMSGNNFTLMKLNQILNNPNSIIDSKIDFWGSRILTVDGSSVKLNDVAQRIYAIGDTVFERNLPLHERCSGVECVRKLRKYYDETDTQIDKLNCISHFILKLKMLFQLADEKKHYNELTGFNETAREKMHLYENFRGFRESHFRLTFPEERLLPSTSGGELFYYKGNRMPDASDFRIF